VLILAEKIYKNNDIIKKYFFNLYLFLCALFILLKIYKIHFWNGFSSNARYWWIPRKLKKYGPISKLGEIISPYGILITEVMLHQTQLKVVIPYSEKWMKVFPTLTSLAGANLVNILMIWQGLGYYSRVNQIHKSSKILVEFVVKNRDQDPHSWPNKID